MNRRDIGKLLLAILELALIITVVMYIISFLRYAALAEDELDCWVICQPDSYVNIRHGPGGRKEIIGYASAGMKFRTDGERNGYVHLVDPGLEWNDGWIHAGFIVYSEPKGMDREMVVRSDGRVACRKCVDGKRTGWVRDGDRVYVWRMSQAWAVTDRGFIRAEYLKEQ